MQSIIIGDYNLNYTTEIIQNSANANIIDVVFIYDNANYYAKRSAKIIEQLAPKGTLRIYSSMVVSLFENSYASDCSNAMCFNMVYSDALVAFITRLRLSRGAFIYICPKYPNLISSVRARSNMRHFTVAQL